MNDPSASSPPAAPAHPIAGDPQGPALARAAAGLMPIGELLERAEGWCRRGQPEAAALLYTQWLGATASPHGHVACFNLGTVLELLGRTVDAEQAYRQAIGLEPGFPQAAINLGHLCERQGRAEDALAWATSTMGRFGTRNAGFNAGQTSASLLRPTPDTARLAYLMLAGLGNR